jgi:hypothetical protein
LAWRTVNSPKWKMLAARTASAWPSGNAVGEMLEVADAAAGDHRDIDGVGDGTRQRQIETVLCAVAIHAGEQDFAGTELLHAARPVDGVDAGVAAAVREDLPTPGATCLASMATTMHWLPTLADASATRSGF